MRFDVNGAEKVIKFRFCHGRDFVNGRDGNGIFWHLKINVVAFLVFKTIF